VRVAVAVRAPLLAAFLIPACGGFNEVSDADRSAIEVVLRDYAESMADAYASGEPSGVAELATEREQNRLAISIAELQAEGRALRPKLQRLVVDSIERAGSTSVAVNTIEVWDLRVVALGTEQTVSESLAQENRLTYSLVREQGRWRVLSRLLRTSTEGP